MCPLPPYIKEQGEGAAGHDEARQGGVLLLPGVGLPPFPCPSRRGGRKGERGGRKRGAPPPPPCPIRTRGGGGARPALAVPPLLHFRPMRPINHPGGTPVLSETSPEHFRYPNIVFQYTNLHVSTILRLLVMSVITFGTLNKLRYIKTHKLII